MINNCQDTRHLTRPATAAAASLSGGKSRSFNVGIYCTVADGHLKCMPRRLVGHLSFVRFEVVTAFLNRRGSYSFTACSGVLTYRLGGTYYPACDVIASEENKDLPEGLRMFASPTRADARRGTNPEGLTEKPAPG